jgi:ATP-dependent Clp protease ATP-binding subunit ClpC
MRAAFTQTLRQVIDRAQLEARELNQEFVSTEHLMLGVLHCETCEAARALQQNHLARDPLRAALLAELPRGKEPPVISGDLPLSPKAQRAVNSSIVMAQSHGESAISTRMLLLALLDEPQTILIEAMRKRGADLDALRRNLAEKPGQREQ